MKRAERRYRSLLGLLPAGFRAEAEADLVEVFRAAHARVEHASLVRRLRFWLVLVVDVLVTSVAERRAHASERRRRQGLELMSHIGWSVRHMMRRPGRSALSALTLGLGIATTVVGLVLVRGVLLSPLPFEGADELVRLREVDETGRMWYPSFPNIADWREQGGRVFASVGAMDPPNQRPVIWDGQEACQDVVVATSRSIS